MPADNFVTLELKISVSMFRRLMLYDSMFEDMRNRSALTTYVDVSHTVGVAGSR